MALSELGDFNRGKSKHRPRNDPKLFQNGIYPFIQTGDIKEANLYLDCHTENYNEFGLKQSKLWKENTLCITIAANIAETALLKYPMCFPDSVVGFTAYEGVSSELFMHYIFTFIKKSIQSAASGSIQDNINIDFLTKLKFRIPSKIEQDKIAAVLSALDKKIALNKQINARLEEMAKTLYDYWFVQFDFPDANGKPYKSSGGEMVFDETLKREIPKGWEVKSLGEVVTHSITGLNPRDNFSLGNGENFYVTIKNIKDNEIKFHTCAKITDEALNVINKRSKLDKGDILFTSIEPIGSTYLLHEKPKNWDINESVFSIRSKSDFITPYFLFMLLSSDEIKSFTRQVSTGSVHKGIRHESLKRFTFAYSGIDLIKNFTNLISPMQQNIFFLQKQNHHLTQLRDFLLPMLMNGQVSVTCRGARDG